MLNATRDNPTAGSVTSADVTTAAARRALDAWQRLHPTSPPARWTRLTPAGERDVFRLETMAGIKLAVVGKRCSPTTAAAERLAYERVLPRLGITPTLRYFGTADEPHGEYGWVFVEDAGESTYDMGFDWCRELAGEWLGRLHAAGIRAGHDPALRERGSRWYGSVLRECRDEIIATQEADDVGPQDRHALEAVCDVCDRLAAHWNMVDTICATTPATVTHGDFAARNLRVRETAAGRNLVAFDWPDAAWAPPAIDLVISTGETASDTASPDAAAYCRAVSSAWPDVSIERVETLARVGELFWHLLALRQDLAAIEPGYVERPISHMADYRDGITSAMNALGWAP